MAYVDSIHRPAKTLTEREQKALLRATGEHRAGFRDHVIYALALGTGLRAHELLALNVGDGLNDAVLALVAGAERVDKVDVVWIERTSFEEVGFELDHTDGRTPVTDLVDRHVDAVRLDLVRLGRFAEQVVDALGAEQHTRLTKKKVAQLIAAAVDAGRVPLEQLEEKVQAEVSKYVEQAE